MDINLCLTNEDADTRFSKFKDALEQVGTEMAYMHNSHQEMCNKLKYLKQELQAIATTKDEVILTGNLSDTEIRDWVRVIYDKAFKEN